jgi:hypothetical protein
VGLENAIRAWRYKKIKRKRKVNPSNFSKREKD